MKVDEINARALSELHYIISNMSVEYQRKIPEDLKNNTERKDSYNVLEDNKVVDIVEMNKKWYKKLVLFFRKIIKGFSN